MSNSNDKLALELFEALNEVVYFLNEHVNREISVIQTRILLSSKMNLVVKNLNAFSGEMSHTADYKLDVIFKVLELTNNIYHRIPDLKNLEKVKLEYMSLTNFIRMQLANIHQDSQRAQSYSTASILSHMLLGELPKLNQLPELPPIETDPQPYFEIFIPLSNSLQSTWGIYNTLLTFITVIDQETNDKWVDLTIYNYSLFRELYDNFNVRELLETKKIKKAGVFFENVYSISLTMMNMCFSLIELHVKYGGNWPKTIQTYGIIEDFSLGTFIELIDETLAEVDVKYQELKKSYRDLLLSRNDDPDDVAIYQDFKIFKSEFQFIKCIITYYKNNDLKDKGQIYKIIILGDEILHSIISLTGDEEKLSQSFYVSSYLLVIQELLPFISRYAILDDNITFFEDFRFEHRYILDKFSIEHDANLFFMKELCKLYVRTHFRKKIDFDKVFNRLQGKMEFYFLKPRTYLTISVLLVIISYLTENKNSANRFQIFADLEANEMILNQEGITIHDFEKFKEYIQDIDNKKETEINLPNREKIIELDHMSWLIPDFSEYFKNKQLTPIKYYPFNLGIDSIIKERKQ